MREVEVAELLDRDAITRVLATYALAIDTRDWDLLDGLFTDDAELDYIATGGIAGPYPEVRAWLQASLVPEIVTVHHLTTVQVLVEGDVATARTYLDNPLADAQGRVFARIEGSYHDQLTRDGTGRWRIRTRRLEVACHTGDLPGIVVGDRTRGEPTTT